MALRYSCLRQGPSQYIQVHVTNMHGRPSALPGHPEESATTPTLADALSLWTRAANGILAREKALADVAEFERVASNPARLFAASHDRLQEEKNRAALTLALEETERHLRPLLKSIRRSFGDAVTFNGRVYWFVCGRVLRMVLQRQRLRFIISLQGENGI
jgi:hypothetical protein